MSWVEEDWTVGLSGRVLQKVKELQVHQERLSRENKQKQLQLDNIHTNLEKQTAKYEEVRGQLQSVQRELHSVREEATAAVTCSERLTQELQAKQAQVCSLEGQLNAARTVNNKLTQEIKRLEAELEKLQNSTRSGDTTLFSTPCWNTSTPWEHSGSRKEERLGQQDEGQNWAPHIRQRLQFSDVCTPSLPRQQHKSTLHRHPSDQSESFSTPSAVFPWEQDDVRPATRRQPLSTPQTPCTKVISQGLVEQGGGGKDHRTETETDISLSEMRSRVSSLEEELSVKAGMLKTIQNEVVQSQKDLAARELSLQKTRDELSLAHTRMAQESERVSAAEQRLKQLQEELKCQRQNAESSRLQHQQRTKELEKQHQRDLTEFQKERQCLERQHLQEINKLSQELQQARTLHNALQAQADKLSLQKQALDKELDTLKEKLKWTEGQLQESLKKGAQTQAKLMEVVHETEGVAVSLEQSRKRERALEEEGKRLAEEQADALRLLKELQELKAVPPLQPVQFCPIGQSFSQPPYSVNSRPSSLTKRPTAAAQEEWKREADVDGRRVEITASYSSDREPGEGIDSEHITAIISPDSECLPKRENERKSNEVESRDEAVERDTSGTNEHSTFSPVLSTGTPTNTSMDHSAEKPLSLKSEQTKATEDLKRENASLRSELRDVQEELQKRLEDLEAQRRAETEARTRLKQLSRKHASQAVEKEQQDKEWKVQLDSERAETERLRKALSALEAQIKRGREEKEKGREEEEEKNKALEDRESEMVELNIQLKKQLAEVKAQLTLEREERKREEEERNQMTQAEIDSKNELSTELAELRAELERNRKEDSLDKENLSVANSPLTYLTLHDDELNCNIVSCDNKPLPSPEQHVLFCESTNQRNMLVSQTTADLIQEEKAVTNPERSLLLDEGQASQMASVPRQNDMAASPLSDSSKALSDLHKAELVSSDMAEVVARLQEENTKETERANQYQVKLEALQSQVTRQTQQLTMAFEKQSQHISGLLAELQEKESALFSQGEELQRYRQELDALKAEKEQEVRKRTEEIMVKEVGNGDKGETRDEKTVEISALQLNLEKGLTLLSRSSMVDYDSNVQTDVDQPKIVSPETLVSGATDSKALLLQEQHPGSVESDKTQGVHHSMLVVGETKHNEDRGNTDVIAELLALRQDNQLLKQRIKALTVSETNNPELQTYCENQEVPVEQRQNSGNVSPSCPMELGDIAAEGQELLLQNETRMEDGGDLENGDIKSTGAEEELEEMSQLKINHLEQQMMALQMKVLTLTEQTQQQAEELAVWRLASQPAPTFDEILPHIDNRSETQDQICAVRQCTVIREDELFLSCCSNKLQGQMLFSRLQHTSFPEANCLPPSKKTSPLQEYHQDTAKINEESEKENQSISFIPQSETCSASYEEKRGADLVLSLDKWDQEHNAKDLYEVPGIGEIKTEECHTGNPETEPISSSPAKEINTTSDSSDRDFRPEMKSVSSQTEESLCPCSAQTASELQCVSTQTEEEEEDDVHEELVDSPPVTSALLSEGTVSGDNMLFSGSFPIPADPARLAERIRRNRSQISAAFDDTEYEPYGLPEVVMKGFADIPTGASCPYIVRRGLLGTTVIPVRQKDPGQEEETD